MCNYDIKRILTLCCQTLSVHSHKWHRQRLRGYYSSVRHNFWPHVHFNPLDYKIKSWWRLYFILLLKQSRRVFTIRYSVSAGECWWPPSKGQYFKPFKIDSLHPFSHSQCLNISTCRHHLCSFQQKAPLKTSSHSQNAHFNLISPFNMNV